MKKIIGIVMVLLMLMSVTVALAGNTKDTQTGGEKVKVIIGYVDKPNQADEDVIRGHGGKTKHTYHIIDAKAVEIPEQTIDRIKRNPRVAYVEMDAEVHTLEETLPWGVDRIDAELVWNGTEDGCDVTPTRNAGAGAKVAIIDTGIDEDHPDLQDNIADGINYVVGSPFDGKFDDNWDDDNGHGTHCAGIVAAIDNGIGVIGVAPNASLYAVKVLSSSGRGWTSDVIAGIEWTIDPDGDTGTSDRMDVISMSLGGGYSSGMKDVCDAAYAAGIVLVAAAGNGGDGDSTTDECSYPAAYGSVIAVGATNSEDVAPYWSNSGPYLELVAPGKDIYSTWNDGEYHTIDGTSMACPHVAGTAALVIASDSSSLNVDVRLRLQETAEDLGDTGFDKQYGYGLVDADNATQPGDAPPVVDIVNPADGSTVSGTIIIEANASDDVSVTNVDFYINDTLLATDDTEPYNASWNTTTVADGSHIIKATATDTMGQTVSDTITVTVDNVDEPPTVEITSPVDGATVSGTITIEASAGDDREVSKVDFYINDTLLATDTVSPYLYYWDTMTVSDGSHIIKATATDTAEQTASDSIGVTVDNTANFMHIGSIVMSTDSKTRGRNIFVWAVATVTILNESGSPVEGATVEGYWSGLTSDFDSETTDTEGHATLNSDSVKNAEGTFNFTVSNVSLTGWIYDQAANVETNNSITAP